MDPHMSKTLPNFLGVLGLDEEPMGLFYTDEFSFTVPFPMFSAMIRRYEESFLKTKTWETVQKKISRSKKAWGEAFL